jgi:putative ABC transport system substrate-binding protein
VKRREFITLLGGATTWSLAARAQQPMPVVGFLSAGSAAGLDDLVNSFRRGLSESGYVEGRNVAIEFAWADNKYDRLQALAADLVRRPVAVIATPGSTPAALAAKTATMTIPVVFAGGVDPVKLGLVASLNRPGGNATGVSFLTSVLPAKQFEILHELVPKAAITGILVNPNFADTGIHVAEVQGAAHALGLDLIGAHASVESDLERAFETLVQSGVKALFVQTEPFLYSLRAQLATLAAHYRLPTMYQLRAYVAAGGLMSYGPDLLHAFHLTGHYVGRILSGEKPADLPVQQATKFEFVINLKAARALGVDVPSTLLALADEVIE